MLNIVESKKGDVAVPNCPICKKPKPGIQVVNEAELLRSTFEPCEKCRKEHLVTSVLVIGTILNPDTGQPPFPFIGGLVIIGDEAFKRVMEVDEIPEARVVLVSPYTYQHTVVERLLKWYPGGKASEDATEDSGADETSEGEADNSTTTSS